LIGFFPSSVEGQTLDGKTLSFVTNGTKDVAKLKAVVAFIPSIKDMLKFKDNATLKAHLDNEHLLIYPFLLWLITSNRAYLRPLKQEEIIKGIPTEHQFIMLSQPPAREELWRRKKAEFERKLGRGKGSLLFFHGSPPGNWHSILRNGLMTEGQPGLGASGKAIWMAQHFQTSVGYCQKGGYSGGWARSMFGQSIHCMAILEIVNDSSKGAIPGSSVNVINDVSIIATRFFLVFKGNIPNSAFDTTAIDRQVLPL